MDELMRAFIHLGQKYHALEKRVVTLKRENRALEGSDCLTSATATSAV